MPCSKKIFVSYSRIRRWSIFVNSSSIASSWSTASSASSTTSSPSSSGVFPVLFDDIVQRHIYFLDFRSHFVRLPVASCVWKWRAGWEIMGYVILCLVCMFFDGGGLKGAESPRAEYAREKKDCGLFVTRVLCLSVPQSFLLNLFGVVVSWNNFKDR